MIFDFSHYAINRQNIKMEGIQMKKMAAFLLILCITFSLSGCFSLLNILFEKEENRFTVTLPPYDSDKLYKTDPDVLHGDTYYQKYYYNEESVKAFENHEKFRKVKPEYVPVLGAFYDGFVLYAEHHRYYYKGYFDFDKAQIKEGDYFYAYDAGDVMTDIENWHSLYSGGAPSRTALRKLYYLDMETCILYELSHVSTYHR